MKSITVLLVSLVSTGLSSTVSGNSTPRICRTLKDTYPDLTLLPEDAEYLNETQVSWTASAWLKPSCIFVPTRAEELSYAVKSLAAFKTKFAMRGGGHMPINDAANIEKGVLISSTNLDTLEFSSDKSVLSIGPGLRWGDVFTHMNNTGLAIVGGRLGIVGVPGLLLGGGISHYSLERGLASTNGNIAGYQCVLADGKVAEVTATNKYSDLYWALQGGGNSYCLVTRFDLNTFAAPNPKLAEASYGDSPETRQKWTDSILDFVKNGDKDPKGAITPVARFSAGYTRPTYDSTLFYNGDSTSPAVLSDFLGGRLLANTSQPTPLTPQANGTALNPFFLADYGAMVRPAFEAGGSAYGQRHKFHVVPILATQEAVDIVHDTYFDAVQQRLANVTGLTASLAYNVVTKTLTKATNAHPGALQGIDEVPAFWVEESVTWTDGADDALIEDFSTTVNAEIATKLEAINAKAKYIYLNDADKQQPVFESYGTENLRKLKQIRAKYDPAKVFTKLMPGGFKVDSA